MVKEMARWVNCPELEVIADGEGDGRVSVNCSELEVLADDKGDG